MYSTSAYSGSGTERWGDNFARFRGSFRVSSSIFQCLPPFRNVSLVSEEDTANFEGENIKFWGRKLKFGGISVCPAWRMSIKITTFPISLKNSKNNLWPQYMKLCWQPLTDTHTTRIHIYHVCRWKIMSKFFNKKLLIFSYLWNCILPQISIFNTIFCSNTRTTQVRTYAIFNRPGCKQTLYFIYSYDNIVQWLKYALFQKKLQIKVFRHQISDKKVRRGSHISISPRSGARGSKDDMV